MPQYKKHKKKYKPGDHKVRSDESGLTVMYSDTRLTWDNKRVAIDEWEEKHPQLIIYPHQDKIAVNDARPTSENDDDLPFGEGNRNDL